MRILDHFIQAIRRAGHYNPNVQAAPACILWTDSDRQWEAIIPALQQAMDELFVLGDYEPAQRRGPAIWLRCLLARTLPAHALPPAVIPVFYLPGVSRQDLRAVESCPELLKPLAELQYRGVIWSQTNAKDWTILAYLQTEQGGLDLDVATDKDTKMAMQLALPRLLEADPETFRNKRLDRSDFYALISGDPTSELLKWLNDAHAYRQQKTPGEWQAFVGLCRYHFSFNPETDGPLTAAERLATQQGAWAAVWERYGEAFSRYPAIVELIKSVQPPSGSLNWRDPTSEGYEGWPQWNEHHEQELRLGLLALKNQVAAAASKAILNLERRHARRRQLVWAEMGLSPLAQAVEHLAVLAETTIQAPLNGGHLDDLLKGYHARGWRADEAVMRALACVHTPEQQQAVNTAIQALYVPWAEESARHLQKCVGAGQYPGGNHQTAPRPVYETGTCILFVDGLRFDAAQRLMQRLTPACTIQEQLHWAALPSVTATGKPAVMPVSQHIIGADFNNDFEPQIANSAKPASHYHLQKLLTDSGWQVLTRTENGDPSGRAWTEIPDIDSAGHNGNLAHALEGILTIIAERVRVLLDAGWKQVEIVTDHGWLYVPDSLPKVNLPQSMTDNQWGRCAAVKAGAQVPNQQFAWYWNPTHYFALAEGIGCFRNNSRYAHGGLSLQECLTIHLRITAKTGQTLSNSVSIAEVDWKGMRCVVTLEGAFNDANLSVDIRAQAANAESSIVVSAKSVKSNGTASLVVDNEDLSGSSAMIVVTTASGQIIAQEQTRVGGDNHD